jgi:glutamyl-Q tRNA(Asp) synthetase
MPTRIDADPARWGDVILVRKDAPASYHLACVVDDAHQGISHVTRGRDLFEATHLHRLLQVLLHLPEPVYSHHECP